MNGRSAPRPHRIGLLILLACLLLAIAVVGVVALYYEDKRLGFPSAMIDVPLVAVALVIVWWLRADWLGTHVREQWLATTLRNIGEGVITTDADGRVILINEIAQELTGWRDDEARGLPLAKIFQPRDRVSREPETSPVAGAADLFESALLIAKDSTERAITHKAAPIRAADGTVTGVVLVFRDVTQEDLAESALRASQELFRLITDHISDFVSVLDLEGRRLYASHSFERILAPARELYLTSAFDFDLSRIESGKMDVAPEDFRLADVIEEVVQTLSPLAEKKGLRVEVEIDQPEGHLVSDRKMCFQILLNLASNAVKFTERGHVRIAVQTRPRDASIAVSDTGIGIKPENMAQLFEAFRQVDGSARRVYEGTGLGLYLCRQLASMLGGRIGAESVFADGSRFTLTLPRETPRHGNAQ